MKRNLVIMGTISTILSVLGCSTKAKKDDEKITQSIEEFNNRKIHSKLTEELIDNTSDDKLLQLVFWTY